MNKHHPEQLDDEIFIGNFDKKDYFEHVGWKTLRLGNVAYNSDGSIVSPYGPLVPIFIKIYEVENAIHSEKNPEKRAVWQQMIDRGKCL